MLAETVEEWTRQWKEDGLREGRQQGLQEGRQEGRQEGEVTLLQKQLARRFGSLPPWVAETLMQASPAQLEAWAIALLDAASLEDVFAGSA